MNSNSTYLLAATALISLALLFVRQDDESPEDTRDHTTLQNDESFGASTVFTQQVPVVETNSTLSNSDEIKYISESGTEQANRAGERDRLAVTTARQIYNELKRIRRPIDSHQWTELRSQLLSDLSKDPSAIKILLSTYIKTNSDFEKSLLRDLFLHSEDPSIEDITARNLVDLNNSDENDWFGLAKTIGFTRADNQELLLNHLRYVDDSDQLVTIVTSLQPVAQLSLPSTDIVNKLEPYINHPDEIVQSEVIRKLGQWTDLNQVYYVEEALSNDSATVRESAIQSLVASGHKSDTIKMLLFETLTNPAEDWNLRVQAHNALTDYLLFDNERAAFMAFSKQRANPPIRLGEG